jgi:hypothetical protein
MLGSKLIAEKRGPVNTPSGGSSVILYKGIGTNGAVNSTFLDSSGNNYTLVTTAPSYQGSYSPFSVAPGNWGYLFDGTTDILKTASNAVNAVGTGDFTAEAFVYVEQFVGFTSIMSTRTGTSASAAGWALGYSSTGQVYCYSNGIDCMSQSGVMTLYKWNHVALTRTGGKFTIYVNGQLVASTFSAPIANSSGATVTLTGGNAYGIYASFQYMFTVTSGTGTFQATPFVNSVTSTSFTMSASPTVALSNATITLTTNQNFTNQILSIGSNNDGTECVVGYISNARLVKGTAVYTSNFTAPTSALTAISGTSFLGCQSNIFIDNSVNAQALTISGGAYPIPFGPFGSSTYDASTMGGSTYFSGTASLVSNASNGIANFGTSDFTVEMWMQFWGFAASGSFNVAFLGSGGVTTTGAFQIYRNGTSGDLVYGSANGFEQQILPSANLNLGQWYHVAVSRQGTNTRAYVNGVLKTTKASDSTNYTLTGCRMGGYASSIWYNGYLAGVRVVKGTALYTGSTFSIPTAPPTAVSGTSLMCLFTNAGIFDTSAKIWGQLNGSTTPSITNAQSKFGTTSTRFPGSANILSPAYDPVWMGGADFTIQAWINLSTSGMLVNHGGGTSIGFASYEIFANVGGQMWFAGSTANSSYDIGGESDGAGGFGSLTANTWTHIAVTRKGDKFRGFVNGVLGNTWTSTGSLYNPPRGLAIGSNYATTWGTGTPTSAIVGYVNDLQIIKGDCLYTANFTPPGSL